MTSDEDARYCAEQCKELIGYCIVGICQDPENNSYGFILEPADDAELAGETKHAWIDCDPEGNGPGFVQVEDA